MYGDGGSFTFSRDIYVPQNYTEGRVEVLRYSHRFFFFHRIYVWAPAGPFQDTDLPFVSHFLSGFWPRILAAVNKRGFNDRDWDGDTVTFKEIYVWTLGINLDVSTADTCCAGGKKKTRPAIQGLA